MHRWGRWAGLGLAVLLAGLFAYFNGGERVTLHVGFTILYRISLVGLVFFAFLLGMVVMFLVGIEHDLRVRRLLREYRVQAQPPGAEPDPYVAMEPEPPPPREP
jgi:hypothetical protein